MTKGGRSVTKGGRSVTKGGRFTTKGGLSVAKFGQWDAVLSQNHQITGFWPLGMELEADGNLFLIQFGMDDFGVRRQSGSGDGALGRMEESTDAEDLRACESGVALRLPPQSKAWRT